MRPQTVADPRMVVGLARLGDTWIGAEDHSSDPMLRFSETDFKNSLPILLDAMSETDRRDLTLLLKILSYLPVWSFPFLIRFLFLGSRIPGWGGAFFRTVRIALKGLIVTLYYDSPIVLGRLKYEIHVQPKD